MDRLALLHRPGLAWLRRLWLGPALALLLTGCDQGSTFEPAQRLGPPALVSPDGEPQLWLLTKQFERVHGLARASRRGRLHHIELRGFDTRTARPLWTRRLLTLDDEQSGQGGTARILGQDGNTVWVFVLDQPFALAADDGRVIGGADRIVARNPALQGVLPAQLDGYAFDGGLVISTVDGRRHAVRGADAAAVAYVPPSDDVLRRIRFDATQWNGGFRTEEFLVRHGNVDGRWLGLYSDREAQDAAEDSWGDKLRDANRVRAESGSRRALRALKIGKTAPIGGSKPRIESLAPLPGAADYLMAGFLVRQGTREPLVAADPPGPIVAHRTRTDDAGRLVFTRIDGSGQPRWSATLPFAELRNRWQLADRLVTYGSGVEMDAEGGPRRDIEAVAIVHLADGALHAWQVQRDAKPATPLAR